MHKRNAIIIVAHGNEKSVATLALLLRKRFKIYLHWDFKFDVPDYLRSKATDSDPLINILDKRIGCLWGEFSLWESMYISAMQAAESDKNLETFTIVSANDLPLMKVDDLNNFLGGIKYSLVNMKNHELKESRLVWADLTVPYGARVDIDDGQAIQNYNKLTGSKYDVFNIKNKFSEHIGSQWCTWTRGQLYLIKSFLQHNINVVKAMKSSLISDEMFTQYIFNKLEMKSDEYHRFIQWDGISSHPIPVTDEIAYKVLSNNKEKFIFGRKYDYSTANFDSDFWKNITDEETLSAIKEIWK